MKTICLIGMMGAGKTSVAKLLATHRNLSFLDIDSIIEKNEKTSISEIFEHKGEKYFRKLEQQTIFDNFLEENAVISLGGGAFENEKTRKFLLENSTVIYLKTSPITIYNRIKNDTSRPLLNNKMNIENIEEIIKKREGNYLLAHKVISTDNKTLEQIVLELGDE